MPRRKEKRQDDSGGRLLLLEILLLVEAAAAMIAVALTVVPSKTGSDWSFAELIWDDPSFWQEVLAAFVATNALLGVLAIVGWRVVKSDRGKASAES